MPVLATCVSLLVSFILLGQARASTEEGVVTVRILYRGSIPPPTHVTVTRDAETCGHTATVHSMAVQPASAGVKDVIVSIEGLEAPKSDGPMALPVVVSNARCRFNPHVAALRTGAAVEIQNQDPILHNTHIKNDTRTVINVAMVAGTRPIVKRIERSGLYRIQCDAHKFMQGYVAVFDHPYFAVSDEEGFATIRHVPAGAHEISLWHETLGELRSRVVVPANGKAAVTVEFPADRNTRGPLLSR